MTKLAVVAYPVLVEEDRRWVEATRTANDPQAGLIRAHLTLVFPAALDARSIETHVRSVARECREIAFAIGQSRAVADPSGVGGHVFLVPDEGYRELVELHDRLYEGDVHVHLRRDIPYVPHITVAAHSDFGRCLALAERLSTEGRVVRGRVRSLDIVQVGADTVRSLASLALGPETPRDRAPG